MPPSEGWKRTPCSRDPASISFESGDHVAGEGLVGLAAGDPQQVVPELLLGIGAGQRLGRGVVGAAHVARVPRVAAAVEFRRRFEDEHGAPAAAR